MKLRYEIEEGGIRFYEVSNLNSKLIAEANEKGIALLAKIGKKPEGLSGTRSTLLVECCLTEKEGEAINGALCGEC